MTLLPSSPPEKVLITSAIKSWNRFPRKALKSCNTCKKISIGKVLYIYSGLMLRVTATEMQGSLYRIFGEVDLQAQHGHIGYNGRRRAGSVD